MKEPAIRIKWKKSEKKSIEDIRALRLVSTGSISLDEGCRRIFDAEERNPTPEVLYENLKWLGYPTDKVWLERV